MTEPEKAAWMAGYLAGQRQATQVAAEQMKADRALFESALRAAQIRQTESATEAARRSEREHIGDTVAYCLERHASLRKSLLTLGQGERERRIRRELQEATERAQELARQMGRPEGYTYRGGAVDWETGLPAGSACAWLRAREGRNV